MTRIAPNLSKDRFDVSLLKNEENLDTQQTSRVALTNRQHIRLLFSARGIRFGTLNLPTPHDRIPHTVGYNSGTASSAIPQSLFTPTFEAEEPYSIGVFNRSYYPIPPNTQPWRGTVDPFLLEASSVQIQYAIQNPPLPGSNVSAPIIRDKITGVATIGVVAPIFSLNSSQLVGSKSLAQNTRSLPSLVYPLPGTIAHPAVLPISYFGRFWVTTEIDKFGEWENTLETRTYQFVFDRGWDSSQTRQRFVYVDSAGSVNETRIMTRRKQVSVGTLVIQTRRRQWADNGAGGAIPVPSGLEVQHRTTSAQVNFPGDVSTTFGYVPWVSGEFPGAPGVDLAAFEAAVAAGDSAAVSEWMRTTPYATQLNVESSFMPVRSQYKWHRLRWTPNYPTFGAAKSRVAGFSDRVSRTVLAPWATPGIYTNLVFNNPRTFQTIASDDCEVNYPWAEAEVKERESGTRIQPEFVRAKFLGDLFQVPSLYQEKNFVISPLVSVEAINTEVHLHRLRSKRTTRTFSPAINLSEAATDPRWQWMGFETLLYSDSYQRVYPRLRFQAVISPVGQADLQFEEYAWGNWNSVPPRQVTQAPVPVEGWNANQKPTISPTSGTINHTGHPFAESQNLVFTATYSAILPTGNVLDPFAGLARRRNVYLCSRVSTSSNSLKLKSLEVRTGTVSQPIGSPQNIVQFFLRVRYPEVTEAGQFTFSIRYFDGVDYSDPIPITVNILPP